ncbi:MAG: TauD/TfdA family dioxygenase [Pseudomonadota bacterium]
MDGMTANIDVKPLAGALGAEIDGLDLTALDAAGFAALYRAFLDHQVLVVRGQNLNPETYLAIARMFGAPVPYPFAKGIEGHPEITVIAKEAHQTSNFGGMWHSDTTYKPDPPKATLLYCIETPPVGGDTIFACQCKAYDALSPGLKQLLASLKGVSSSGKNAAALRGTHLATGTMQSKAAGDVLTAAHPAVRTHPENERDALFLNRSHTTHFEGWSQSESAALLDYLFQHQIQPEFTARVRWQPGTLVIWDNRSSQHCAINDYDGHRREMWRITLEGVRPV